MRPLLFCILFFPCLVSGQLNGKVTAVQDGDTFTLLTKDSSRIKVRLHGIDSPERGQAFYKVSKQYLSGQVSGRTVRVMFSGRDRYGRILGIAFLDTININERLLAAGMAWHFKRYDNHPGWAKLENEARANKRGLWQDKYPVPPWEWRGNKIKSVNRRN